MFIRPCGLCGSVFEHCGSCQPGRRYCGVECSKAAREASARLARAKYAARDSPEGLAGHAREESERRSRHAEAVLAPVGDQRIQQEAGALQVPVLVTPQVAMEARDARLEPVVSPLPGAVVETAPVEWILVAWPEVMAAARQRLGTEATCPFCGRRGQVVRVVSVDEWRRWVRRGLAPPT